MTGKFPELAGLQEKVKRLPAILDGEIVVFEGRKPSFAGLQSRGRMNDLKRIGRASMERPAVFIAFDVLYSAGESIMNMPLLDRKKILEAVVVPGEEIVVSQFVQKTGRDFYGACVKEGLEGVMAKKMDGPYLPGRRSSLWQKFRYVREADLVICGYQPGTAGRRLASLVLGGNREGRLVYQGKVGTGFDNREAGALLEGLRKLEVDEETLVVPGEEKRRIRWVRPLLVCSVEYLTTTAEGCLRHPVYKRIRWDKPPGECPALGESASPEKTDNH
jgi:bifunctional non-homologous end joining protein LigD/DNA ligase-1